MDKIVKKYNFSDKESSDKQKSYLVDDFGWSVVDIVSCVMYMMMIVMVGFMVMMAITLVNAMVYIMQVS